MSAGTLVCIHGNSLDSSIFDLVEVPGFEKLCLNLPGHGGYPLNGAGSFQDFVDSIYDRISNIPDVVLLGCSLGGHIAHHLLARLTPLAIITLSAPPLNLDTVGTAFRKDSLGGLLFQRDITEAQADALADSVLSLRRDQKSYLRSLILSADPDARHVIAKSILRCEFLDEMKLLENFRGEKILIYPSSDSIVNRDSFQAVTIARVFELPGNHALPVDNPRGLNDLLGRELAKLRK